jgi:hypothetical protein
MAGAVVWFVVAALFVFIFWYARTPAGKATVARERTEGFTGAICSRQKRRQVANRRDDGTLRCPHCGGTHFTAKRSNTGETVEATCVSCGLKFKRG